VVLAGRSNDERIILEQSVQVPEGVRLNDQPNQTKEKLMASKDKGGREVKKPKKAKAVATPVAASAVTKAIAPKPAK